MKLSFFILAFLLLISIVSFTVPSVYASTVETRYMRNDYTLPNTEGSSYVDEWINDYSGNVQQTQYLAILAYEVYSNSSTYDLTGGTKRAVANGKISNSISATWTCPNRAVYATDKIRVGVYGGDTNPPASLLGTFDTSVLSATYLNTSTWSVTYYLLRTYGGGTTAYYWRHSTSIYTSKIGNFTWTGGGGTNLNIYGSIAVAPTISSGRTWTETIHGSIAVTTSEASRLTWIFSRAGLITIQTQLDSGREETFFRNSLIQLQGLVESGRAWTFSVSSLISPSLGLSSIPIFPFSFPQVPTDEEGGGIINRVVPVPWNMLIIPLVVFMGFILVFVDRYRDRKWKKKMWRRIKQEEKETLGFLEDVLKEEKGDASSS